MKSRFTVLAAVLVAVATQPTAMALAQTGSASPQSAAAPAQSPPNFSGTWLLNKSRSVVPSVGSTEDRLFGLATVTWVIEQQGAALKIDRHARLIGAERSIATVFYTDGREASNTGPQNQVLVTKSYWEGPALITELDTTVKRDGRDQRMKRRDVMTLSADGKTITIETVLTIEGESTPEHYRTILDRR